MKISRPVLASLAVFFPLVLRCAPLASAPLSLALPTAETPPASTEGPVKSSLRWDKSDIEVIAQYGQKMVHASYHFTNTGTTPLSVREVTPSCGCVTAELKKLDYAPGESGDIKIDLDLTMDQSVGLQERLVTVRTSDAPEPATLRLKVHVPEAFALSTETLSWARGEKPETKQVTVSAGADVSAFKLSKVSENSDFTVVLTPDPAGQSYLVDITPVSTDAPCYAQIRLQGESPSYPYPLGRKISAAVK